MDGKRRVLAMRSAVAVAVAGLLARAVALAQDAEGHDTYLNQPGDGAGEWLGIVVVIAVVAAAAVWLRRRARGLRR